MRAFHWKSIACLYARQPTRVPLCPHTHTNWSPPLTVPLSSFSTSTSGILNKLFRNVAIKEKKTKKNKTDILPQFDILVKCWGTSVKYMQHLLEGRNSALLYLLCEQQHPSCEPVREFVYSAKDKIKCLNNTVNLNSYNRYKRYKWIIQISNEKQVTINYRKYTNQRVK